VFATRHPPGVAECLPTSNSRAAASQGSLGQEVAFPFRNVPGCAGRLAMQFGGRKKKNNGLGHNGERISQVGAVRVVRVVRATSSVNIAVALFFFPALAEPPLRASLSTQVSTTWNFVLVDTLVYRKRATHPPWRAARSSS